MAQGYGFMQSKPCIVLNTLVKVRPWKIISKDTLLKFNVFNFKGDLRLGTSIQKLHIVYEFFKFLPPSLNYQSRHDVLRDFRARPQNSFPFQNYGPGMRIYIVLSHGQCRIGLWPSFQLSNFSLNATVYVLNVIVIKISAKT